MGLFWVCARLFARLASASNPRGLSSLSGKECSLGEPGGRVEGVIEGACRELEEGLSVETWSRPERFEGEGERETIPEAMEDRPGLPMERNTVSRVFSIFRRERVSCSCFLTFVLLEEHQNTSQAYPRAIYLTSTSACPYSTLRICTYGCLPHNVCMAALAPLRRTSF